MALDLPSPLYTFESSSECGKISFDFQFFFGIAIRSIGHKLNLNASIKAQSSSKWGI